MSDTVSQGNPKDPQNNTDHSHCSWLFTRLGGEILLLDTTHLVAERTEIKLKMSCKFSPHGLLFTVPKDALQTAGGEESPTVWPSCEPRSYNKDFPSKTCSLVKLWLNWYGVNNHFVTGGNSCLILKTGQEPLVGKVIGPGGTCCCCWFRVVRWPSKYTRWYS